MGDFLHRGTCARHVGGDDHAGRTGTGEAGQVHPQLRRDLARIGTGLAAWRTRHRRHAAGRGNLRGRSLGRGNVRWFVGGRWCHLVGILDLVVGTDGDAGIVRFRCVVDDEGHRVADLDYAADVGDRAGEETLLEYLDVHDGLVGFHGGDDVAALDD